MRNIWKEVRSLKYRDVKDEVHKDEVHLKFSSKNTKGLALVCCGSFLNFIHANSNPAALFGFFFLTDIPNLLSLLPDSYLGNLCIF